MQNADLVGLSRQMALSRELDVVANNIANLDTTGYKADSSLFEEYLGSALPRPSVMGNGCAALPSRALLFTLQPSCQMKKFSIINILV